MRLAKKAGAKYVVFTTRHHDGFSLWDSKVNPFNSVNY
ncbi:MAG: alpha-L-fucosidase, partial [Clostridia bacterium]|nr:alpha-L-fucosidase [Clostridia bacterium]